MSRYLSIDVGIKNLAYCICTNNREICEWNVISLAKAKDTKDTKDTLKPSLIELGKQIKHHFDELNLSKKADIVLIENQVAPIASNMKSLQCMIAQYFIMNDVPNIHFVSASMKLKGIAKKGTTYKERKALGVMTTIENVKKYEIDAPKWLEFVQTHKKKDDLCDAYMQCIAFISADN